MCTADVPAGTQLTKVINWERMSEGAPSEPVADNGDSIIIETTGLSSPITTSVLMVTEDVSGQYVYTCTAIVVSQLGDPDITMTASSEVTVRGVCITVK